MRNGHLLNGDREDRDESNQSGTFSLVAGLEESRSNICQSTPGGDERNRNKTAEDDGNTYRRER